MGLIEEINKMIEGGKTEADVIATLQQMGYSSRDASDAVAQVKIKRAVSPASASYGDHQSESNLQPYNPDMQQSVMNPAQKSKVEPLTVQEYSAPSPQQYAPQPTTPQESPQYGQYQQQYEGGNQSDSSADVISEIAEQVVNERLSSLKSSLEAIYNLKNTFEAKIESMDERLKRIEKTIDRLQLSVLQKVGEYVANVDDIKREVIETQKSFKSLLNKS